MRESQDSNNQRSNVVAGQERDNVELVRQPGDGEGRCNSHAHLGDFTSCLLLGR